MNPKPAARTETLWGFQLREEMAAFPDGDTNVLRVERGPRGDMRIVTLDAEGEPEDAQEVVRDLERQLEECENERDALREKLDKAEATIADAKEIGAFQEMQARAEKAEATIRNQRQLFDANCAELLALRKRKGASAGYFAQQKQILRLIDSVALKNGNEFSLLAMQIRDALLAAK